MKLNRGFTMIDAMIASALFIITVSSLISVISLANTQLSHQKKVSQGINISEGVIEQLLLAYSDSSSLLTAGDHGPLCYNLSGEATPCSNAFFKSYWHVDQDIPLPEMIRLIVKTQWMSQRGMNRTVKFTTYRK